MTPISKTFIKVGAILFIGCLYLVGNFLVGLLYHELVDHLIKSPDTGAKEAAGITFQVIHTELVLYQLSYLVLSFGIAFVFDSLGAIVVGVLVLYQYLLSPIITYAVPLSAVYLWSQFVSYQIATLSGAMLGLQMRKWIRPPFPPAPA